MEDTKKTWDAGYEEGKHDMRDLVAQELIDLLDNKPTIDAVRSYAEFLKYRVFDVTWMN